MLYKFVLTRLPLMLSFGQDAPNEERIIEQHLQYGGKYRFVTPQNMHNRLTGLGENTIRTTNAHRGDKISCQTKRYRFGGCLNLALFKCNACLNYTKYIIYKYVLKVVA